jgi:hypothetical protein
MMVQGGGPPDTSVYYRVAYAWAAILYAGYSAILWARGRRLRRSLAARTRAAGL